MIVEDDEIIRVVIVDHLSGVGFAIIEARHADHALQLINAMAGTLDVVFTDVQMPGSMDGIALADHLQRLDPDLPVILTSGANHSHLRTSAKRRFVPKPYQVEEIERHIREMTT